MTTPYIVETARILEADPEEGYEVEVQDRAGGLHLLVFDEVGELERHDQNSYPTDWTELTEEQEQLLLEAQQRARYELDWEADLDLIRSNWDPYVVEWGIAALNDLPVEEFAEEFELYYDVLQKPEAVAPVPDEDIMHVIKRFTVTEDGEIPEYAPVSVQYTEGGEEQFTTEPPEFDDPYVGVVLPPLDYVGDVEFPEAFQELLVTHLMAQVRDIFYDIGQQPPEYYQVEGVGKPPIFKSRTE